MPVDFIDSNVLLYLFDETNGAKREIAERVLTSALLEKSGIISFQVVQETLNVLSTKLPEPASAEDTERFLEKVLLPLWRVMPSAGLYRETLRTQDRYKYHFYDALIIAAAREAGAARLLTEDLQDGQKIEGLEIVNPFRAGCDPI
ncbi:MAG: PIN domain-containing protein [Candidatus Hydrogenedentes bacterium]|nr:PIN domain-containing protein [Candidatus Hydrogenedentota bacterium]